MSQMSDYLENALFNHVFRGIPMTSPAAVYVALFTSNPTDAATGNEVIGNAYVRQAVTFGAPTDGSGSNSAQVTFPVATGTWGLITHAAIYDAESGGNMLNYGPLSLTKQIDNGDQFIYKVGNLVNNFQ